MTRSEKDLAHTRVQAALVHLRGFYRNWTEARKLNPSLRFKPYVLERFMAFTFADDWPKLKAAVELSKTQGATIAAQQAQITDLQNQLAAAQAQIPPKNVLDALADAHNEAQGIPASAPPATPPAQ